MAENVIQPVEVPVPLSLFGGLVTEMSPADLPEGISPDCQDVIFFPGGVSSRPGAHKWTTGLFPANVSVTYQKTFTTSDGNKKNLFLTSDGQFWVWDLNTGVTTLLHVVSPGSYASSISAFGKELVTFHNNQQGTDIPRIYDGEYFDRATQWGPPTSPSVVNTQIPSTVMAVVGASPAINITLIDSSDPVSYGTPPYYSTYYSTLQFSCATPHNLSVGMNFTVAGNSNPLFNHAFIVSQVVNTFAVKVNYYSSSFISGNGGTLTAGSGTTATRSNNEVSVTTTSTHGLSVGFQVQISGIAPSTIGTSISSIVINNEQQSGIATITTLSAHGLLPENVISINGVTASDVGTILAISRTGQVVTVNTNVAHNLQVGSSITISGVTDVTYDGSFTVLSVPTSTQFTYSQVDTDSSSSGGSVGLLWPVTNGSIIQNYFTVVSVPSSTVFTVEIFYSDGTWNTGTITFNWNGNFFVTQVLSPTQFVYQQYGPNATAAIAGTVTPLAQIAPGLRQCVVMFQTRSGFITKPSAPFQFISNGGQYLTINNIPLGPPEVVKRIIAFTGADGSNFFYISQSAFINGITVSTSTTINDNTTTSILVDFSDNTLFASTAIDIPGNNLFAMGVLGPCLSVSYYASRAAWFGMKNSLQNFMNLGFDGGYLSSLSTPLGWTVDTPGGTLSTVAAGSGFCWRITGTGALVNLGQVHQTAYQDAYNVAIFQPRTEYSFNARVATTNPGNGQGTIQFEIYSPTSGSFGFASVLVSQLSAAGSFFSGSMGTIPAIVPSDIQFRVYAHSLSNGAIIEIDDIEVFPTLTANLPLFQFSYINLPEQIDLITGNLGATDDDTLIQGTFTYKDSLLFLTQFGLHETSDLAGFEPFNWRVREVARNCGSCGPKAITTGENFSSWISSPSAFPPVGRGLYLYTGGAVYKLSQEVQPDFDSINFTYQKNCWLTNDPVTRRMYMGLPVQSATAPNRIYVLDYREMDTASDIASRSPIHISFTGRMVCSDLSRKWTRWNIPANCGEIMEVPGKGAQFSIGTGVGIDPSISPDLGFSQCYWLDQSYLTDDDYGIIVPYYTTYFFVNHELEQQINVGAHRKLYKRYYCYISGTGSLQVTPYGDTLTNPWPLTPVLPLSSNQLYDLGDGLNVIADRAAFKISSLPLSSQTNNGFTLQKLIITMMSEPIAPLRFGAL